MGLIDEAMKFAGVKPKDGKDTEAERINQERENQRKAAFKLEREAIKAQTVERVERFRTEMAQRKADIAAGRKPKMPSSMQDDDE